MPDGFELHAHDGVERLEERILNVELRHVHCLVERADLLQASVDRLEQGLLQPLAALRERHGDLVDDGLAAVQDAAYLQVEARP